jgi:transketolase
VGIDLDTRFLEEKARKLRRNIIRMIAAARSGHPGGSLSAIDILTYLYFLRMRIDPSNSSWPDRDRFILSKGHCSPALYAVLAERGYFPEEHLWTLREIGSILQGHPDMRKTPGVDMTTGSLGQGLSCGVGMALGGRLDHKGFRVYVMVSDGELQSGQVWEAAMAASQFKLDHLIAIIDNNLIQSDGVTRTVIDIEPAEERWSSFGWEVWRINGHSFAEIDAAFENCQALHGKPHVIIADTVKGKGVSFMENSVKWHSGPPSGEEEQAALRELSGVGRHD